MPSDLVVRFLQDVPGNKPAARSTRHLLVGRFTLLSGSDGCDRTTRNPA